MDILSNFRSMVAAQLPRTGVLLLLILPLSALQAAENLKISFSEAKPAQGKVYSSNSAAPIRELRVLDGNTVNLQTERGRHYEARAGGWRWTQVQEVAAQVNAVSITPHLEGDNVDLEVQVFRQDEDRRSTYNTVISGPIGEWLQLLGPEQQSRHGSKVYGTGSSKAGASYSQGLYIKVEIVGGPE
ncbi:MAG: hypothetical protein ABJ308_12550 [Halieaceae bacterium]